MAIYDAITRQPVESPDLSAGYLVDGTIITGYTLEVIPGTVTDARPAGLRRRVPIEEPCQWYYLNEPEPEQIEQPGPSISADVEKRLSALESGLSETKEGLSAAKIMLGVE